MKQACVVGILTGALVASAAWAHEPADTGAGVTLAAASADQANAPAAADLGSIRLARQVMADGKPLAAGTYTVRLTTQDAQPPAVGETPSSERWVEFVQDGAVKGREVVSIVPASEIAQVAEGRRPKAGASQVELLKGNDYMRVWINKGGNNYLIHLPTGS